MISRFNTKWEHPPVKECPIKIEYELIKKIIPISFNDDKSVKEYTEEEFYIAHKSKWKDYIKSFDIGSPSDQIMEHLQKGTPLITAHTLPHGDYTQDNLIKGAEVMRFMREKGITLDMVESALKAEKDANSKVQSTKEVTPKEEPKKEGE